MNHIMLEATSSDFSWFGLTPRMTYALIIIIAFVLLVGVMITLVLLVKKANKDEKRRDINDLNKEASKKNHHKK